jgi:hypothetical protein
MLVLNFVAIHFYHMIKKTFFKNKLVNSMESVTSFVGVQKSI